MNGKKNPRDLILRRKKDETLKEIIHSKGFMNELSIQLMR